MALAGRGGVQSFRQEKSEDGKRLGGKKRNDQSWKKDGLSGKALECGKERKGAG